MTASERARDLLSIAAVAADSKQATELVGLDVSEPLPFADAFLLASGRTERQVHAIVDEIEERLLDEGVKALRREGRTEGRWVLLDFGELIVHVFHEEERLYYQLERLWKDCPVLDPGLPGEADRAAES